MEFLIGLLFIASSRAEVRVFVQDSNGIGLIKYECTSGELVRAFALDISVNQGQIIGISNYLRGPSTARATGYGIFPASFRDHLAAGAGTNINWGLSDYTPVAIPADAPADTLPGINSSGVTLEFGGLWDPTDAAAVPGPAGTLCALQISQPAKVSVAANMSRGGVVSAFPETIIRPVFIAALIGPAITSATLQKGVMKIRFQDGELQTATSVNGPWTDTGIMSGDYSEVSMTNQTRFYRVRSP